MKKFSWKILLITGVALISTAGVVFAGIVDYSVEPPFISSQVDPNVLLDLSIETPMQGAAYNDQNDGGVCGGRVKVAGKWVGVCYFKNQEYLGIFDPDKCYTYSGNKFVPCGATNSDHECAGGACAWSGNFLNWATMTAIDEFRWALTGGNRVVDTTSETVVQRANMTLSKGHSWFPVKMIDSSYNVAPNTVTPYSDSRIYIYNHKYQFDLGTSWGGHEKGQNLYARVKVCDQTQGLEDNCVECGGHYKPQGLIQNNASKMRFAVMGYSMDNSHSRDGGVLRSNMKYVGPKLPSAADNPKKEFDADGIFLNNPERAAEGDSGVINYLNKFGANGYKSYDPVGELYYECLNFYKDRGPTPEYSSGLTAAQKDGFPALTVWEDPIQHWCQKNYIIAINDANPWNDKQLPGTYFTNPTFSGRNLDDSGSGYDWGEPTNPDPDIDVTDLTNTVGDLEGLTGTSQCIGCVNGNCDMSANSKVIPGLGEIMGTCPYTPKENSYYVAGLAYYANTHDLRPDLDGKQTVNTFMIDSQEYSNNPLVGQMNMLWLTGKYGGFGEKDFQDTNSDGNDCEPNLQEEWDADGDGEPDNYVLASNPKKLIDGLTRAFTSVLEKSGSGTAASVISNSRGGEGAIYQAMFFTESKPEPMTGRTVSWYGDVHTLFVDEKGNMREDTNENDTLEKDSDLIVIFDAEAGKAKLYDPIGFDPLYPDSNFSSAVDFSELKYIWDAFSWLSSPSMDVATQRPYTSNVHQRYIFTDRINTSGSVNMSNVDSTDVMAFTPGFVNDAANDNYYFLNPYMTYDHDGNPATPEVGLTEPEMITEAENIIKFIRGEEGLIESGTNNPYRNRTLDMDGDGANDTVFRLGDIVHSTPTVVSRPAEDFDLLYRDASYQVFRKKYLNRRIVIYTGANDGMLHAFNGGFYDKDIHKFCKLSITDYDLGAELWAYVPNALLPHLRWLKEQLRDDAHDTFYHVYYVDLKPRIFDARIFPDDADHPNGWGTVLIGGMRLGGGPIGVDTNGDGDTTDANDLNFRSSYFALDITNPEVPPGLLWSFSDDNLGFTTSYPTPIRVGSKWFIVFGSGPVDYEATRKDNGVTFTEYGGSNRTAGLYIINARDGTLAREIAMDGHSFLADPIAVDFDLYTGEPYEDLNNNGCWDSGEPYTDKNSNGVYDSKGLEEYSGEAIYIASDGCGA